MSGGGRPRSPMRIGEHTFVPSEWRSTVPNSSPRVRITPRWHMSICPHPGSSEVMKEMAEKKATLKDASAKEAKAKDAALEPAVTQIERDFGQGALMRLGERRAVDVAAIPTGSLALDLALGIGGVPRGRIIELFGPESSGKTTLCYHIMAEAQKAGGTCAFIDAEHAIDPGYARRIGLNVDELLVS